MESDLFSTTGTLIANVYSQGQPLGGATIRVDAIPVQVITGNDGIGRLEALPQNTYYVSAQAPGKPSFEYNFRFANGGLREVILDEEEAFQ